MFCRVCGFREGMGVSQNFQKFRVPVWKCYRTHRSSGYCGTGVQSWQEVPGGYKKWCARTPGIVARGVHNWQRCGYECAAELTEVAGTGMKVLQNFQKFRVLWDGRTELAEVLGRYKNAVPVPRVRVWMSYRTHRSSLYGYERCTQLTEVTGTGNTRG